MNNNKAPYERFLYLYNSKYDTLKCLDTIDHSINNQQMAWFCHDLYFNENKSNCIPLKGNPYNVLYLNNGNIVRYEIKKRRKKICKFLYNYKFNSALPYNIAIEKLLYEKILTLYQSHPINNECIICYENNVNIMSAPCNHKIMCHICLYKVMQSSRLCPICRQSIDRIIIL